MQLSVKAQGYAQDVMERSDFCAKRKISLDELRNLAFMKMIKILRLHSIHRREERQILNGEMRGIFRSPTIMTASFS